jgi:predicted DNA binding CopG/RHH family protein
LATRPSFATDEEAEAFLDQDLSDLDFSQFKPVHFEFQKKAAQLNMRLPRASLEAVKDRARARGNPTRASSARRWSARCGKDERSLRRRTAQPASSRMDD